MRKIAGKEGAKEKRWGERGGLFRAHKAHSPILLPLSGCTPTGRLSTMHALHTVGWSVGGVGWTQMEGGVSDWTGGEVSDELERQWWQDEGTGDRADTAHILDKLAFTALTTVYQNTRQPAAGARIPLSEKVAVIASAAWGWATENRKIVPWLLQAIRAGH